MNLDDAYKRERRHASGESWSSVYARDTGYKEKGGGILLEIGRVRGESILLSSSIPLGPVHLQYV